MANTVRVVVFACNSTSSFSANAHEWGMRRLSTVFVSVDVDAYM